MERFIKVKLVGFVVFAAFLLTGCISMNVKLPADYSEPLKEFTLEGTGTDKIVVIPIRGHISDDEEEEMMRRKPSLVKEVVSQIKKAEMDPNVRGVVLKVHSPGGTITGSDILYNELKKMKTNRDMPIVACMMDIATSGGYYVSLPADHIVAHRTTITGSVGVIFIRPKFQGLMEKIGVSIETSQSGQDKDMGSPFRPTTSREEKSFERIIDEMAELFKSRVVENRQISDANLREVMTAKVYTAKQALDLGLIDQIGFTDDALAKAKLMAGLSQNARVVMYRRTEFADDNIYNNITNRSSAGSPLVDLGPITRISDLKTGFYYTWPAATE